MTKSCGNVAFTYSGAACNDYVLMFANEATLSKANKLSPVQVTVRLVVDAFN
jgi:hypothetical protein